MKANRSVWKWIISLRTYSLAFVILPYLLGILVAVSNGGHKTNIGLLIIGLIPMMLCHLAANLQSDIYDYKKGIDVIPDSFSGGIVRQWITVRQAIRVVILLSST